MTYSKTHHSFAEQVNDLQALVNPEMFLGPNWETVLNFWKWIDTFSEEQWKQVGLRYNHLKHNTQHLSWLTSLVASDKTISGINRACAYRAVYVEYPNTLASPYATFELIGMHLLLEQGNKLAFVPLFDGI